MIRGVIGPQRHGSPERRNRFVQPSTAEQRVAEVVVRVGEIGLDLQGSPVALGGPTHATESRMKDAEVAMSQCELRVELGRPLEEGHRVSDPAFFGDGPGERQERLGGEDVLRVGGPPIGRGRRALAGGCARVREARVDVGQVRLKLRRALEARERAIEGAEVVEDPPEVVDRRCEIGIDRHGLEKRIGGLRKVAPAPVSLAEVGVASGLSRRKDRGSRQHHDGFVESAALEGDHAHLKGGQRVVGLLYEHLTIEPLRLCQLSRAVVLIGCLEKVQGSAAGVDWSDPLAREHSPPPALSPQFERRRKLAFV